MQWRSYRIVRGRLLLGRGISSNLGCGAMYFFVWYAPNDDITLLRSLQTIFSLLTSIQAFGLLQCNRGILYFHINITLLTSSHPWPRLCEETNVAILIRTHADSLENMSPLRNERKCGTKDMLITTQIFAQVIREYMKGDA